MTFTPQIWADVVAACYPPDMRQNITDIWRANPGYFFELTPPPTREMQKMEGPVILFERSDEIFQIIINTFEELTLNDPDMSWDHLTDIWLEIKPWWEKFEQLYTAERAMCIIADSEDEALGNHVFLQTKIDAIVDYIDQEIIFDHEPWQGTTGGDFVQAITLPYQMLNMLRPTITGDAGIDFLHEAGEWETVQILTHLIYGLRAFYIWLAERRIYLGDRLLANLRRI